MASKNLQHQIVESFSGTSPMTYNVINKNCVFIACVNRSTSDLTFTINDISVTVSAQDRVFEEYYEEFTQIVITAGTDFQFVVGR